MAKSMKIAAKTLVKIAIIPDHFMLVDMGTWLNDEEKDEVMALIKNALRERYKSVKTPKAI